MPTSSSRRGGRRWDRPGGFAPGMRSGTACKLLRLLLLFGGVAVALAMNVFPLLALLASGAVPLLVTLLATISLCLHPSGLGNLACVVFVSSIAQQLGLHSSHGSSITPCAVCRRAASLASNTAWSRRCWSMMLNSASGSCTTRLNLISVSILRRNSNGSTPGDITSTSTLPCFSVYGRPPGFATSVIPLSTRDFRRANV